jgi:hypothetical protein
VTQLDDRRRPSLGDYVWYLVGVVGLSAALTSLWLGMRAVMNIGGSCASGGPYQVAVECPPGVDVVMILSIPALFLFGGLMLWKGVRLGGPWAGLVVLAWPALFLSLGWNFLEYGFRPRGGGGPEFGWLIPGVLFVLMGGVPLWLWIRARPWRAGREPSPGSRAGERPDMDQLARQLRGLQAVATRQDASAVTVGEAMDLPTGPQPVTTLASELERLASLHQAGAIDSVEYDQAKAAVIAAASRGELG